jgi:hypothetical protein
MIRILFLMALCIGRCHARSITSATLHVLLICNTEDPILKEGFKMNLYQINHQVDSIAKHTGLILNKLYITGNQFNTDSIRNVIKNLVCTPKDVIWFHYSGHGMNQNWAGKYPVFLIGHGTYELATYQIKTLLEAKKPRLILMMMDCCNYIADGRTLQESNGQLKSTLLKSASLGANPPTPQNYQQLFLKSEGIILLTAARQGQIAYTHESVGGILTTVFTDMLSDACRKKNITPSNWETFIKEVVQNTQETAFYYNKIQNPQFEVLIKEVQHAK